MPLRCSVEPACDRDRLRDPQPENQSLDQLVLHSPLQVAMLVKAQGTQQVSHEKRARAACQACNEGQTFRQSESETWTGDGAPPRHPAVSDFGRQSLNLTDFFVAPLRQELFYIKPDENRQVPDPDALLGN